MEEYLVVDGYNIIYAWPYLDRLKNENLEHARDKLVDTLVNFSAHNNSHVFVVFDAHQVKSGIEHTEEKDGVRVIYTREGETADAVIEKMVGELINLGRVYVVTSDYDEQRLIFGRGAYRLTPKDLQQRIEQCREKEKKWSEKRPPTDNYLEDRLAEHMREMLEQWRRRKK